LIVDPRDGTRLFLSGVDNPAETYRSTDGGKSWQRIADQTNSGSRLTIDSVQNVIYRPDGDKLYRSEDNGQTWEQFGAGYLTHSPWQILPDPQNAKKLWLVGECGTRLAVSEDNGKTFLEAKGFADDLCQPILLIDKSGQRMYIVNWGSFYRSDDGGNTWRSVGEVSGIYRSAALDPSDPNVVYLGSTHRGVLKTTNGGQSWSQMNAGLNAASINDLAINPANPQMVYAATDGGAFVTVDGGENWSPVREGLGPNPIVYSIAVDPGDSSKVYAVAPDGVFRLSGTAPTTAASP
jgi:photosystem II stability/assembly factor-like uncharacterized protein